MQLAVALAWAFLVAPLAVTARDVTHEDIRDAMLSMVHMVRSAEDKLERHEYRERALGEHVKKALAALEKRHNRLEPIKGTLTRLDERINSIETILIQRDERERSQLQKTAEVLEKIEKALLQQPSQNLEQAKALPAVGQPMDEVLAEKLDTIANGVQALAQELDMLKAGAAKLEETTSKINEETNKHMHRTENVLSKALNKSEEFLVKYENKLSEYLSKDSNQQENEIVSVLKQTNSKMIDLLERNNNHHEHQTTVGTPLELPYSANNATMEAIQEAKYAMLSTCDNSATKLYNMMDSMYESLKFGMSKINKALDEETQTTQGAMTEVNKQYEILRGDVQGLNKVERVLLQTADNILDTKKRVEYGVHQIVLDVSTLIKQQSKEMNSTVNKRFDEIEITILDNQSTSLANFSSKIEQEMSEVWRQIGIMTSQLTTSANALERLEAQTELYTNGSLQTMDNMEGKVGKITSRMGEVDENLNYLLGRLSLVMQEFNQVKSGLGNALDTIRSSFHEVQDKLKDAGPGPHNIPKDSNEELENRLN